MINDSITCTRGLRLKYWNYPILVKDTVYLKWWSWLVFFFIFFIFWWGGGVRTHQSDTVTTIFDFVWVWLWPQRWTTMLRLWNGIPSKYGISKPATGLLRWSVQYLISIIKISSYGLYSTYVVERIPCFERDLPIFSKLIELKYKLH